MSLLSHRIKIYTLNLIKLLLQFHLVIRFFIYKGSYLSLNLNEDNPRGDGLNVQTKREPICYKNFFKSN